MTEAAPGSAPRPSWARRVATFLYHHPRAQLAGLLSPPLAWLAVGYLGSLVVLLIAAFWTLDTFTVEIVREFSLENFKTLFTEGVYRDITARTLGIAAAVTATDFLLAMPIAFFMAKVAGPRTRGLLLVAVLMPLWSNYLVKVYAWRIILQEEGILNWALDPLGFSGPGFGNVAVWLVMSYLWLPYMILPIYAGLERLPSSLLEASGDLGAKGWRTFRTVVLPLILPAAVAGSIFTFSLTMGDYITPKLVSSTQFIANVVYDNVGVANNLPFAAAYATIPVLVMIAYLAVAKRLGAFENL